MKCLSVLAMLLLMMMMMHLVSIIRGKKVFFFPSLVAFSKFSENGLLLKLIVIASFKCV